MHGQAWALEMGRLHRVTAGGRCESWQARPGRRESAGARTVRVPDQEGARGERDRKRSGPRHHPGQPAHATRARAAAAAAAAASASAAAAAAAAPAAADAAAGRAQAAC